MSKAPNCRKIACRLVIGSVAGAMVSLRKHLHCPDLHGLANLAKGSAGSGAGVPVLVRWRCWISVPRLNPVQRHRSASDTFFLPNNECDSGSGSNSCKSSLSAAIRLVSTENTSNCSTDSHAAFSISSNERVADESSYHSNVPDGAWLPGQ